MLPPEFGTPLFSKKSRDPAWRQPENSSMLITGQADNLSSDPFDKCSVNVCNHEPTYSSDASSMTFAISVSLGLDVTSSPFSIDSSTIQYEPLLADVAPMQLCEKEQAELAPPFDQHLPNEQSVSQGQGGAFEIRQPAALNCLIVGDSQTSQNESSPTRLLSIDIANEQREPISNPMSTRKITRPAEPSSRADQHSTSPQPIPAIITIPFLEIQNLPKSRKSLPRSIRPKPAKDDSRCSKDINSSRNLRNLEDNRFTCDICNKSFPKYYNLERHKRTHTGEKKFACDICHKSFTENYLVKRHMTIHTDKKKFACNFCNETFIRNGSLVRHMRKHTGEKTFACHVCDKKFGRDDVLKNHLRTHAVEKNQVSRNDSLPVRTASLEFDKQQQASVDSPIILVAYPTLMPSDFVILINANTAEVDVRNHITVDPYQRHENLV